MFVTKILHNIALHILIDTLLKVLGSYVECHVWSITIFVLKHKIRNKNFQSENCPHITMLTMVRKQYKHKLVRPTYHNGIKCKLVLKQGIHT